MAESSDKMWSTGEGMTNHFIILALRTPWKVWKGKMIGYWKRNYRSVGAQYATGDQWKNNSRKNEGMEPKQKQYDGQGGLACCGSWGCKESDTTEQLNQILSMLHKQLVLCGKFKFCFLKLSWIKTFFYLQLGWNFKCRTRGYGPLTVDILLHCWTPIVC